MSLCNTICQQALLSLKPLAGLPILILSRLLPIIIYLTPIFIPVTSVADEWDTDLNLSSKQVYAPIFDSQMQVYIANESNDKLPSLTLIHGVGGSAHDFAPLIPLLAEKYKLILVDLPGYGNSTQSSELYSASNYALNLAAVLPALVNQTNFIIGHSMGGNIALQLAEMAPDLAKRLILIDAAGILHKYSYSKYVALNRTSEIPFINQKTQNKLGGWIDKINRFIPDFTGILLSGPSRTHILKENSIYISAISVMHEDLTDVIRSIKMPSLVIWGEADPVMPYQTGIMLNYLITDSQFELIPDVGHSPQKEASTEVYQMINDFLNKQDLPNSQQQNDVAPTTLSSQHYQLDCHNDTKPKLSKINYSQITISNCPSLEIDGLSTQQLSVLNSTLVINKLNILNSEGIALTSVQSNLTIWGGKITAQTAMELSTTNLDLNGVDITVSDVPFITDKESRILASVSLLNQGAAKRHWHGFVYL